MSSLLTLIDDVDDDLLDAAVDFSDVAFVVA
jgi:hypothetical protein